MENRNVALDSLRKLQEASYNLQSCPKAIGLSQLEQRLTSSTEVILKPLRTSFEALYGRKPFIKHLRTFGSMDYSKSLKKQSGKLNPRGAPVTMLGYANESARLLRFKLRDESNGSYKKSYS